MAAGIKLRINPEVCLRILKCAECGSWVEDEGATSSPSFRGFGAAALKHLKEEHPDEHRAMLDSPEEFFDGGPFYIFTERRFELAESWYAEEARQWERLEREGT